MQEDKITGSVNTIEHGHHEVHEKKHFAVSYSVADIGALTTPDDAMTISFTTPNTETRLHMTFSIDSAAGGLYKLVRGKTGGGASPTGVLQTYNSDDASDSPASEILDVAGANASKVSYDATLFTGGVELVSNYIGARGQGSNFTGSSFRSEQERILRRNTQYQISLYNTANVPGTITLSWYEHVSRIID